MEFNHSSYSHTTMNKSIVDTDTSTTDQESGWTSYFEDFMVAQQQDHHLNNHNQSFTHHHDYYNDDNKNHHQQQQQQHDLPELSDAASYVDWNSIPNLTKSGVAPKFPKKLKSFKKTSRRTKELYYDDSLEDTASSPVNSPKVGSQHMGFNQIKVDGIIENSLEKGSGFNDHLQLQKIEDQSLPMRFEENNSGGTDLRKRGLCLVPISMFANYV